MNLLITLGDSWTAGVGCYTNEALEQLAAKKIDQHEAYMMSLDSFSKNSWPKQVASNLRCKLINLAQGGSSNCAQAKLLFDSVPDDLCNRYDKVFVVWLLSDSYRPSYYVDGKVKSWTPVDKLYRTIQKLTRRTELDTQLETNFYIKCVEKFCKSNNYTFLFSNTWGFSHSLINHPSDMINELNCGDVISHGIPEEMYAHCRHPNEQGHKVIASKIQQYLTNNYLEERK